jgi:hypothetical protein
MRAGAECPIILPARWRSSPLRGHRSDADDRLVMNARKRRWKLMLLTAVGVIGYSA